MFSSYSDHLQNQCPFDECAFTSWNWGDMERHYAGQHRVGIILFQYYIIIIIFYYVGGSHRVPAVQQGQQVGHRALAGAGGLYNISPYDWVVTVLYCTVLYSTIYSVIFIMRPRVRACKLGIFRTFSLDFVLIL